MMSPASVECTSGNITSLVGLEFFTNAFGVVIHTATNDILNLDGICGIDDQRSSGEAHGEETANAVDPSGSTLPAASPHRGAHGDLQTTF